ncbi:MAG: cobalt ECF transporter T component CbiQ [Oscillospiraceae bacterium]|nr:cobalt ECF transporter T component CbiQ [Oscillospiraceae bacterium]
MNKMEKALFELSEMDELAARRSPIHSLNPAAKLITTIIYIVIVASFGKYDLSGLIIMVLYPAILFQVSGVPISVCFYKLRIVLPLVIAVGLFNPIFDRAPLLHLGNIAVSGGVVSMITLMLKGVFCLSASFLLIATTSIDSICAALRALHVPGMLVTLLLLTFRYVGVLTRELSVMTEAYKLRAPGQKGIHRSAWGSFLGQLLLRSMDRAEELYSSMQLRGFKGEFHYAPSKPFAAKDAAYMTLCCGIFILLRFVRVTALLGRLFVR